MATVTNTIKNPNGTAPTYATCEIFLVASTTVANDAGWVTATDVTILGRYTPTVTAGAWTASLTPNADIDPAGTVYKVVESADGYAHTSYISVGAGGGALHDLLTSAPTALALWASTATLPAGWWRVADYGTVDTSGASDSSAAVLACLAAVEAGGGGTIIWPKGTIRCDSQILFPNDGASPPKQQAQRWLGAAAWFSGKTTASTPAGGTILDLRYSSGPCVETLGEGALEITGITFTQGGSAHAQPFIHSTNTTLLVHDCGFVGHSTKAAATANQDCIVLGGSPSTTINGSTSAPFQGYGTTIERCYFNKIKRGVWGRMYANGVKVINNTFWAQCGGGTGSVAIEFDGGADNINYNVGGTIAYNLIECVGYATAIKLDWVNNFMIVGNDFYDNAGISTAYITIGNNATYNHIVAGHYVASTALVSQVNRNTIIDPNQSQTTTFTEPVAFTNALATQMKLLVVNGGSGALLAKPAVDAGDATRLLELQKSDGTVIFRFQQNGLITGGGTYDGALEGAAWRISPGVWERLGVGGGMVINSGTGGSYVDIKGYGVRFYDHTGSLHATFGAGDATLNAASAKTLTLSTNGTSRFAANSTGIGFFAATPAAKPTVTGSRGGNAALASVLTALATLGLITDSSTA